MKTGFETLVRTIMNRRDFLKSALAATGLTGAGLAGASGCASPHFLNRPGVTPLDKLLEQRVRVMWVAAHPDDESMGGAILAKAGPRLGNPLYLLVLTHGDGGECLLPEGCYPDLATVRGNELKEVARLYGATLQHEYYWNAPLPVESFPKRHEIGERWIRENGDPTIVIAKAIRDFKPDVLLTFCPLVGFTGHPEHQLASRFATAGVRLAADRGAKLPGGAHRVENVYYGLNKYWPWRLFGAQDPLPMTEVFYARQDCVHGMTCAEVMAEYTKPHRTQRGDMDGARLMAKFISYGYLHRADPFTEVYDPLEPAEKGGMG
jgi:LmbE family N-acetylglucosaminyl deacetylase